MYRTTGGSLYVVGQVDDGQTNSVLFDLLNIGISTIRASGQRTADDGQTDSVLFDLSTEHRNKYYNPSQRTNGLTTYRRILFFLTYLLNIGISTIRASRHGTG